MSEASTVVTSEHFRYLAERTMPEDAFLRELKHEAQKEGIPSIWISAEQASFMQILLKLCNAKQLVEVGTLAGYSAIALARALPPGGRVRTIEICGEHVEFSRRWVARSNVADRVEVFHGPAQDILPTFDSNSADAAFIDADKVNYPLYLRECLRIVCRGGLIMVDNAFAFGQLFDDHPMDGEVPAMLEFNDYMPQVEELHSIIVPLGDGCWVGVKR